MLYHFCFVLVLVAASNGQRYAAPNANYRPNINVPPNNNRSPSAGRFLSSAPANVILNATDPLFNAGNVPGSNVYESTPYPPIADNNLENGGDPNGNGYELSTYPPISDPNDPGYGREPIGNGYDASTYPPIRDPNDPGFGREPIGNGYDASTYPPIRDPNDPGYGREPIGNGYETTTYPPVRDPNDPAFGRDPNGGSYESTRYPPIRDPNLGNGLNPTTDYTIHATGPTDSHGFDVTTKSNDDLYSTTGNYVTTTDSHHIYPGSNNTGVTGEKDAVCRRRFGYYKVEGNCDSYLECRNYEVFRRLCPDGMHFNPNANFPEYPCGYPGDVPCIGRGVVQPSRPTRECPHQFGFFPLTDPSLSPTQRCSSYVMCSAGKANIMDCPFGLAFNAAAGRCDWPEQVPECHDFLGFHCPTPNLGEEELVMNYKFSDTNCYYFWSCAKGQGRVLSCDYGLAFDPDTGRCVDEDLVACGDRELEPNHDESTPANAVFLM